MSINRYDEELEKPLVANDVRHIKYRLSYMIHSQIISFFSGMFFLVRQGFQSLWLKCVQKMSSIYIFESILTRQCMIRCPPPLRSCIMHGSECTAT